MRHTHNALLLLLAAPTAHAQPGQIQPAQIQTGQVQTAPDPTPLLLKIVHQLRTGTLDRSLLGPELSADTSADDLTQAQAALTQLGEPTSVRIEQRRAVVTGTVYVYAAVFPAGTFRISIYITREGKVGGYKVL